MNKSYIRIVCYEDAADPKCNRLQLRTDPPKFIELQPGENILSVEEYPDLRFGFKQDETNKGIKCEEVIEVDFSHFDASSLTTMEEMFSYMSVEKISFGKMNTPKLKNTVLAFSHVGIPIKDWHLSELDISSFDFSNVEDVTAMFQGANIITLRMENANLSNLKKGRNFIRLCHIQNLILDGLVIKNPELLHIQIYGPATISLKRCNHSTICAIIEAIETKRAINDDCGHRSWEPANYILDSSLRYDLTRDSHGQVICTLTSI